MPTVASPDRSVKVRSTTSRTSRGHGEGQRLPLRLPRLRPEDRTTRIRNGCGSNAAIGRGEECQCLRRHCSQNDRKLRQNAILT
eukprot:2050197-Rhodomonas_salina.1